MIPGFVLLVTSKRTIDARMKDTLHTVSVVLRACSDSFKKRVSPIKEMAWCIQLKSDGGTPAQVSSTD
jgi:hypothetical protein